VITLSIINEYIKSTSNQFIELYEKLFNLIFKSGVIPEMWVSGTIKPLLDTNYHCAIQYQMLFQFSTKAQNNFFFLFFKISKKRTNIQSVVEYPDRNPHWFSLINNISSKNSDNLVYFMMERNLNIFHVK
jgi:hypothetical protein